MSSSNDFAGGSHHDVQGRKRSLPQQTPATPAPNLGIKKMKASGRFTAQAAAESGASGARAVLCCDQGTQAARRSLAPLKVINLS